jgi:hypothetical protein
VTPRRKHHHPLSRTQDLLWTCRLRWNCGTLEFEISAKYHGRKRDVVSISRTRPTDPDHDREKFKWSVNAAPWLQEYLLTLDQACRRWFGSSALADPRTTNPQRWMRRIVDDRICGYNEDAFREGGWVNCPDPNTNVDVYASYTPWTERPEDQDFDFVNPHSSWYNDTNWPPDFVYSIATLDSGRRQFTANDLKHKLLLTQNLRAIPTTSLSFWSYIAICAHRAKNLLLAEQKKPPLPKDIVKSALNHMLHPGSFS